MFICKCLYICRQTNEDGRLPGLLTKGQFISGTYRLKFDTGAYFKSIHTQSFYPFVEVKNFPLNILFEDI